MHHPYRPHPFITIGRFIGRTLRFLFVEAWPLGFALVATSLVGPELTPQQAWIGWTIFGLFAVILMVFRFSRRHREGFAEWRTAYGLVLKTMFRRHKGGKKCSSVS